MHFIVIDCFVKEELFVDCFSSGFRDDHSLMPSFEARTRMRLKDIPVSVAVVANAVRSLSVRISTAPNVLPSFILKRISDGVFVLHLLLFRLSLKTHSTFLPWKTTVITPLLQKLPFNEVFTHRPISIISSICKVMEIIIRDPLYKHYVRNNLFSPKEFSSLKRKSIVSHLLIRCNARLLALNDPTQIDVLYIIYDNAFRYSQHPCGIIRQVLQG